MLVRPLSMCIAVMMMVPLQRSWWHGPVSMKTCERLDHDVLIRTSYDNRNMSRENVGQPLPN
jgi:hypothetical protein